jgi:serine/threonine protein kinase
MSSFLSNNSFRKKLGEGGSGEVFETTQVKLKFSGDDHPICTKKIDLSAEDLYSYKKKVQQAKKEAEILKALNHPNIGKYLDDCQEVNNFSCNGMCERRQSSKFYKKI